jgi:hypothetical protein
MAHAVNLQSSFQGNSSFLARGTELRNVLDQSGHGVTILWVFEKSYPHRIPQQQLHIHNSSNNDWVRMAFKQHMSGISLYCI